MKDQYNPSQRNRGFSLLEMAIVMGIIGVMVAGVLVGRTLLVSSQLQTVMTDADNYITAIGNFKESYQALPGDFATAETLWGTDSSGCPTGGGATGTCNGNGDGKVGGHCDDSGMSYSSASQYEQEFFWPQLASSGLISLTGGTYGFVSQDTGSTINNRPRGSIDGSSFVFHWIDEPSGCFAHVSGVFPLSGTYGNVLVLSGNSESNFGALLPDEAESIDRKMDDGIPSTGKVRSFGTFYTADCFTGVPPFTYQLTGTVRDCSLIFLTDL
jgi:prepilin-type N-terminal cleavage/methylation domain-containing protein